MTEAMRYPAMHSQPLKSPNSSVSYNNDALDRILLPTEDLSSTFESELKKSRIIKSSIMKDSLELLNKQYLEDLETLLDDNGISEILKSHFSTKRLKVDSADKKVIHRNPSTDEFNKNDILACDEVARYTHL